MTDIKRLIMLAKDNNAEAINELGYLYFSGNELKQDFQKAFQYYSRAAELNHPVAQFNLGILYAEGKGTTVDGDKAAYYYRLAGEKDILQAQYNLAVLLQRGTLVPQDLNAAIHWYQKAANANQPNAQHNLGCMYFFGQGVERNLEKAKFYFTQAADKVIESKRMLGEWYRSQQDNDNAFYWYRQASEAGDIESIYLLGIFFSSGPENQRNIETAIEMFCLAAQGHHEKALEQLKKLALNHPTAQQRLRDLGQ